MPGEKSGTFLLGFGLNLFVVLRRLGILRRAAP
jgi:hypothetical protein